MLKRQVQILTSRNTAHWLNDEFKRRGTFYNLQDSRQQ